MSAAGTRRSVNRTTAWPPANAWSRLCIVRTISIPGWSMSARNIVAAPSAPFAMMMAKPAPSAPVMNHLVPLITQ